MMGANVDVTMLTTPLMMVPGMAIIVSNKVG
jgi:hypothetical protein